MRNIRKNNIYLITFLLILLGSCTQQHNISKVEGNLVEIKDIEADKELESMITPYKSKLDSEMNEIIGVSDIEMDTDKPEGLLGNFIADLLIETANKHYKSNEPIDFCIVNNGGLRTVLPKGEITRKKIYELMPFENELVVVTLGHEALNNMFAYLANKGGAPIAGFKLKIREDKSYEVKTSADKKLEKRDYKVLTSDYLADGGGNMSFFADSLKREVIGLKVRDAIIEYINIQTKEDKTLNAKLDNRIYYAK